MITKQQETTSTTTKWKGITFGIETILSDYDQIVIDVPVFQSGYNSITGHWEVVPTNETRKWRLERIEYSLTNRQDNAVGIHALFGRGFTKANTLRVQTSSFYSEQMTDELLSQIPDHYHDKAKEQFLLTAKELTEQMNQINANGLSLTPQR
jgi:hypothetical protein